MCKKALITGLLVYALLLGLISCSKKSKRQETEHLFTWEVIEASKTYVDPLVEEQWNEQFEKPSCKVSVSVMYPLLADGQPSEVRDSLVKSLSQRLYQSPSQDFSKEGVKASLEEYVEKQIEDYKLDIEQAKKLNFDLSSYSVFNSEFQYYDSLTYSKGGLISIVSFVMEYSGGAHGNEGLSAFNYDLSRLELVTASMLFENPKDEGLVSLLLERLMDFFDVATLEELEYQGVFNYRMLEVTNNFYVDDTGITFCYNPYELAIYAVGPIRLHLTFDELSQYLNEEYLDILKR